MFGYFYFVFFQLPKYLYTMTLLEHVFAVKGILSRGPASDDFRLSDRFIAHFLQVARARLIEQKINKYHSVSEQSYQDWCVNLELSNFHGCCTAPDVDCQILKSTLEVPKFLNSRWGHYLTVLDLTGRVIPEITLTQNRFSEYALSTPSTGWFMHNNYLYIVNNKVLTNIILNALFNDPETIHSLNCPGTAEACPEFMQEEFPIDSDLVDPMYRLAIELLSLAYRQGLDTENNFKDVETAQAIQ